MKLRTQIRSQQRAKRTRRALDAVFLKRMGIATPDGRLVKALRKNPAKVTP